jgi:hypothetical protein
MKTFADIETNLVGERVRWTITHASADTHLRGFIRGTAVTDQGLVLIVELTQVTDAWHGGREEDKTPKSRTLKVVPCEDVTLDDTNPLGYPG